MIKTKHFLHDIACFDKLKKLSLKSNKIPSDLIEIEVVIRTGLFLFISLTTPNTDKKSSSVAQ